MAGNDEQTLKPKEEGEFGTKLDYDKPKCQDAWAGILFWLHVVGVIASAIYIWGEPKYWENIDNPEVPSIEGIYTTIGVTVAIGIVIGLIWLFFMVKCAKGIMRIMLITNMVLWIANVIIGFSIGWDSSWPFIIMSFLGLICSAMFTFMIWNKMDFSAALLTISTRIVLKYKGALCLSFFIIAVDIGWYFVWGNCWIGWMYYADENNFNGTSQFLLFLLLVSFYWGNEVWKNVVHTTACGIGGTWYFEENEPKRPFCPALKRTMTTSFGSVCLGALIVAVIAALRTMVQQAYYKARSDGQNACCLLILTCLMSCLENMARYFNMYAFAHVAIYGTNYITAAKQANGLFSRNSGWQAIINDSLVGGTINMGSLVAMVFSMVAGYYIGSGFAKNVGPNEINTYASFCAVIGGIIGFMLCVHILQVIGSMVIALFVCFAEIPQAMVQNHKNEFEMLTGIKVEWKNISEGIDPTPKDEASEQVMA